MNCRHGRFQRCIIATVLVVTWTRGVQATTRRHDQDYRQATQRLTQAAGSGASVRFHHALGNARFVRFDSRASRAMSNPSMALEPHARSLLRQHGKLFGITNSDQELALTETRITTTFGARVGFVQSLRGVEVFGTYLLVHYDNHNRVQFINGTVVPDLTDVNTNPALAPEEAAEIALRVVFEQTDQVDSRSLEAASPTLLVYQKGLVRGILGLAYLAYEVEVTGSFGVREFVYVCARSGKIVGQITGVHSGLYRIIYDGQTGGYVSATPGANIVLREGDAPATSSRANRLYDYTGMSYRLFDSAFQRDSYDGQGAVMRSVVDLQPDNCGNAFWDGRSTNFCSDFVLLDVVGHEWAHAYSEYTHGLIYAWQPGALNEAYSDIFGEMADLINENPCSDDEGFECGANPSRTSGTCAGSSSKRWLIGDDMGGGGMMRDMWTPSCENGPATVGDSKYYCAKDLEDDDGGVHTNSLIPSHAFAMLVDGGKEGSVEVPKIGATKAAHIYWQAMNEIQGPTSDFADHADALVEACRQLSNIGVKLRHLVNGVKTNEVIANEDCDAVESAITAVQMRDDPPCDFKPFFSNDAERRCASHLAFEEDFEQDPAGAWEFTHEGVNPEYTETDWEWRGDLPDGKVGKAIFAVDSIDVGDCRDDDQSGQVRLKTPAITLPSVDTDYFLSFEHYVATEAGWDGGNVRIRVNNGAWETINGDDMLINGYNTAIFETDPTGGGPNTNPMKGEPAFSGTNEGSLQGMWGETQANISRFAEPGATIEIRFDFGVDGCNGLLGWFVDNVRVFHQDCEAAAVECTTAVCDTATGQCAPSPTDEGATCGAGGACTESATCRSGECQEVLKDCSALDGLCATGACSPDDGECVSEPVPDGDACDDGDDKTGDDACQQGVCQGEAQVDQDDPSAGGAAGDGSGDALPPINGGCDCSERGGTGGGLWMLALAVALKLRSRRRARSS